MRSFDQRITHSKNSCSEKAKGEGKVRRNCASERRCRTTSSHFVFALPLLARCQRLWSTRNGSSFRQGSAPTCSLDAIASCCGETRLLFGLDTFGADCQVAVCAIEMMAAAIRRPSVVLTPNEG